MFYFATTFISYLKYINNKNRFAAQFLKYVQCLGAFISIFPPVLSSYEPTLKSAIKTEVYFKMLTV